MEIRLANTFFKRLKGLMFKKDIEYGLLFSNIACPSIHTSFMRFEIDVYFLDENKIVLDKITLKPWRYYKSRHMNVKYVLETKKDYLNIKIGDKLDTGKLH